MAFQGYTQQTVDFMWGIRFNNERGWFLEHKDDYINTFLTPTRDLGEQVYKDHLWWCIRTGDKDWTGRPTFWFELGPDYYSFGLGFWSPAAALMETYRKQIDAHPEELSKLVRQFNRQSVFTLDGPEYARSKGQTSDLLRSWYQKKSLSLRWEGPLDERIFTSALAEDIIAGFKTLIPFYHYFNKLVALTPRQERRGEDA